MELLEFAWYDTYSFPFLSKFIAMMLYIIHCNSNSCRRKDKKLITEKNLRNFELDIISGSVLKFFSMSKILLQKSKEPDTNFRILGQPFCFWYFIMIVFVFVFVENQAQLV